MNPFDPGLNQTISQANATSSAGGALPDSATQVGLTNTSDTAIAYFACQQGTTVPTAVVPGTGVLGSFPVLPGQQVRVTVPSGVKRYATIASAANGALLITPGAGF